MPLHFAFLSTWGQESRQSINGKTKELVFLIWKRTSDNFRELKINSQYISGFCSRCSGRWKHSTFLDRREAQLSIKFLLQIFHLDKTYLQNLCCLHATGIPQWERFQSPDKTSTIHWEKGRFSYCCEMKYEVACGENSLGLEDNHWKDERCLWSLRRLDLLVIVQY